MPLAKHNIFVVIEISITFLLVAKTKIDLIPVLILYRLLVTINSRTFFSFLTVLTHRSDFFGIRISKFKVSYTSYSSNHCKGLFLTVLAKGLTF